MAVKHKPQWEDFVVWVFIQIWFSIITQHGLAEEFHWSETSMQKQADNLQCVPKNIYSATVLKKDAKNQNKTMMGKVADMEVCALLCCEIERCDAALLEDKMCYSVACANNECEQEKANGSHLKSFVLHIKRLQQNSTKDKGDVTGVKYDENKSTIVTKQAVTSSNEQPGKAPRKNFATSANRQESLVAISNQSPMEQLMQSESNLVHDKATVEEKATKKTTQDEAVKKSNDITISNNIQSLSDHLKKVNDRSDMTASLEEADKRTVHPKLRYHKHHDLRHNLISPIIIGAFTCMAVIALSGFAMAIIKYQKERNDKQSQSTQTIESR